MKPTNIADFQAKIVSLAIIDVKPVPQSNLIDKPASQEDRYAGCKSNFFPIAISYDEWLTYSFCVEVGSKLDS